MSINHHIEEQTCNFIKRFRDNLPSLELLLLFGRHPNEKLSRTFIFSSFPLDRFDAEKALQYLVNNKFVIAHSEKGGTGYSLTRDGVYRFYVLQLTNIGEKEWQFIADELLRIYEIA